MYVLRFYAVNQPYGFLSNFAVAPMIIDGKIWQTVEHYFQAMKFAGTEYEEIVRNQPTPAEAKRYGRKYQLRNDWEQVKVDVMRTALRVKYTSHHIYLQALLMTYPHVLVEHTSKDRIWADGCSCPNLETCTCVAIDGSCRNGTNLLGRLLMELRLQLAYELGYLS